MTSESTDVRVTPEGLAEWLAAHDLSPARFADLAGLSRETVYRWLPRATRTPPGALGLILDAIKSGLRAPDDGPSGEALRAWMKREAYEVHTLAIDLGMHRTSVSRWMQDDPRAPAWLDLVMRYLSRDANARRRRRRRVASKAEQQIAVA